MLDRILRSVGVEPGKLKVLCSALLVNDLRASATPYRLAKRPKRVQIPNMLIGVIICTGWGLFFSITAMLYATVYTFTALCLGLVFVMTGCMWVAALGPRLSGRAEPEIIGVLPVSTRTLFLARLIQISFPTIVYLLAVLVPFAGCGIWVKGSDLLFPLILFPSAICEVIFVSSVITVFYSVLVRMIPSRRLEQIEFWASILLGAFIGASGVLIFCKPELWAHRLEGWWWHLFPPAWFAGAVGMFYEGVRVTYIIHTFMGPYLTLGCAVLCISRLGSLREYQLAQEVLPAGRVPGKGLVCRFKRLLGVGYGLQDAGFTLTTRYLMSDPHSKPNVILAIVYSLTLVITILAMADPDSLRSPFDYGADKITPFGLQSVAWIFMLFMLVGIPDSPEWQAGYIFHVTPFGDYGLFYSGVKKALFMYTVPAHLLLLVVLAWLWPLGHALWFTFLTAGLTVNLLHLSSILIHPLPFSEQSGPWTALLRTTKVILVTAPIALGFIFLSGVVFREGLMAVTIFTAAVWICAPCLGYLSRLWICRRFRSYRLAGE